MPASPQTAGGNGDDDGDAYALADAPRKAKAVRARAEALPGVGVSARGVVEAAAPTRKTLTPRQVLAAFGGRIEPVRPTILYRLWILIVAAVMVLLPVVYIAIIGLVIGVVVYHAIHSVSIFQHVRGRAVQLAAIVYAAPWSPARWSSP